MQFEYDPERLIREIKKRPGLWDADHPDYRAKHLKHKLWGDVVIQLLEPDVKVTKSEMRELEIQIQKKWKSIRDCFIKNLMHPKPRKRPYIYWNELQFLAKNKDAASKEGASSESEDGGKPSTLWRFKRSLVLPKDNSDEVSVTYDNSNQSDEVIETRQAKVAKTGPAGCYNDEFIFANVDGGSGCKVEGDDPDKMFLLSLLPHLKSVPEPYQLNVKMELMQVLQNANFSHGMRDQKIL